MRAVFFSADDGMGGAELWKCDGTSTGTVRVKDIATGSATSGCGRWIRHFRPRRDDAHERLLLPRSGAELLRIGDFRDCQLRRDPGGPILSVTAA